MQKPLVLTKLQNLLQGFKEKFVGTKIGHSYKCCKQTLRPVMKWMYERNLMPGK